MDAVKLGGKIRVYEQIRVIADAEILVVEYISLTHQSPGQLSGFKTQYRDVASAKELTKDTLVNQEAGSYTLLFGAILPEFTTLISKKTNHPRLWNRGWWFL